LTAGQETFNKINNPLTDRMFGWTSEFDPFRTLYSLNSSLSAEIPLTRSGNNEEIANSAETIPATIAPHRPDPVAGSWHQRAMRARTPEATQAGKLIIEAIAPATMF
jgi:hypothetical protein